MAEKHKKITLSVDLLPVSKKYLDYVREHLTVLDLRREDVVRAALYRYQHFWLPLAAKYPDKDMEAPDDIYWVWHCHMLSPVPYCEDCERLVGRVIGNATLIRSQEENAVALKESQELWEKEYPPEHPFFVDISGPVNPEYRDGETNFKAHVLSNALRQKEFDYQVSLPHYHDPGFVLSSVIRYKQFLYLRMVNPTMWVIPTYDVDFVWHSHQLCPRQYQADCYRIMGCGFNHGDIPPGLPPDAKLHYPDLVTRRAWLEEFGESISLFGAGYRGENPVSKLEPMNRDELAKTSVRDVTLRIKDVTVDTERTLSKKAQIKIETDLSSQKIPLFRQNGHPVTGNGRSFFPKSRKKGGDNSLRFDTSKNLNCILNIRIQDNSSSNQSNENDQDTVQIDMTSFLNQLKKDKPMPFNTVVDMDGITQLDLEVLAEPVKLGPSTFSIKSGKKEQVDMTELQKPMWGPIPLPEEPLGRKDVPVNLVTFKIMDSKEEEAFTCRLIDCKTLEQEGAQVFFKDKMVAVGHPIGGIQLPYPSHVSNKKSTATLNPMLGEQAALIKNDEGDWGILVGHLVKEKIPQVNDSMSVSLHSKRSSIVSDLKGSSIASDEEREYMTLNLWILEDNLRLEFKLPNEKNEHELCIEGVKMNLSTGSVEIDNPDTPVAECLAVAFTLKILWRLCRLKQNQRQPEKTPINRLKKLGQSVILANRSKLLNSLKT